MASSRDRIGTLVAKSLSYLCCPIVFGGLHEAKFRIEHLVEKQFLKAGLMKKHTMVVILALGLASCQLGNRKSSQSDDLTYSLTENNCSTGVVPYRDDADLCRALVDDARNNWCARELRRQMFQTKKCAGDFGTGLPESTTSTTLPAGGSSTSSTSTTTSTQVSSTNQNDWWLTARTLDGGWSVRRLGEDVQIATVKTAPAVDINGNASTETFDLSLARSASFTSPMNPCTSFLVTGMLNAGGGSELTVTFDLTNASTEERRNCERLQFNLQVADSSFLLLENLETGRGQAVRRLVLRIGLLQR